MISANGRSRSADSRCCRERRRPASRRERCSSTAADTVASSFSFWPGFQGEIDRPLLDGAHRHLDVPVRRDQQDDRGRVLLADLPQPVETLPAAGRLLVEVHVEKDDRGRLLLEDLGNGPGIALGPHPVALLLEQQAGGDEDILVVVDYEDERGGFRHGRRFQGISRMRIGGGAGRFGESALLRPLASTATRERARRSGTGEASAHRVLVWIRDAALQHAGRALPAAAVEMPPSAGMASRRGIPARGRGGLLKMTSPGATPRSPARAEGYSARVPGVRPADTWCIASGRPPTRPSPGLFFSSRCFSKSWVT